MSDEHSSPATQGHEFPLPTRLHGQQQQQQGPEPGLSGVSSVDGAAAVGSDDHFQQAGSGADFTHALGTPVLSGLHPHRPSTQLSHSLDQIQGHTAQLLGGSAESDPWLLRHCRFDELGLRSFHKVHYRHAGGVPTRDKIPVHFLVSADELSEPFASETRFHDTKELWSELDSLVPVVYGARLVRL